MSKKVVIYSKTVCPYCVKAKFLLKKYGVDFEEILVTSDEIMQDMIEKSGGMRTVPQIFVDDEHIGDCDGIYQLESKGELEGLLK